MRAIKDAEVLTPSAQNSTNDYADVSGSTIDAGCRTSVAIVCKNTHGANSLDWKVMASIDGTTYVEAQAEATLAAAAVGTYSTSQALYRYYKVQVKSTVGGAAAQATVHVIGK